MTDNFVGFARSPKPDSNRQLNTKEFVIHSAKAFADCHFVFTTKEGLELWLGEVSKFDFRPGGKNRYQFAGESFGATYATIRIPKQVILVTESLGEVTFAAKVANSTFDLTVSFKKALLPDEVDSWQINVEEAKDKMAGAMK
jgi:hypothetical protein